MEKTIDNTLTTIARATISGSLDHLNELLTSQWHHVRSKREGAPVTALAFSQNSASTAPISSHYFASNYNSTSSPLPIPTEDLFFESRQLTIQTTATPKSSPLNHSTGVQLARNHQKTIRQVPLSGQASAEPTSAVSQQAAAAAAAYALAQEDRKAANKLNAELCKNFSVGYQNELGGTFTTPNYPSAYPVNLICTKLIEAPPGHYVVLDFRDQFNIEEAGTDCDNDKIEIRDGRFGYSNVLARYCGNTFPQPVKSTDEAMWLRFISDGSITHTGFKAVYRFVKQSSKLLEVNNLEMTTFMSQLLTSGEFHVEFKILIVVLDTKPLPPFECRFNVTTAPSLPNVNNPDNRTGIHSGVIKNTDVPEKLIDYSKQYNVSLECIWNITVTPGWKIYLVFSNYEISKPNDCDSNFIEIYEENLTEENQTVKFCGTRTEPQQSKSNVFNIRHHAIPSASSSKFEIIYTAFRERGQSGCDTREFDCDDGTCIHESLKCDGTINCKYRYDEATEPGPCAIGEDVQPFFETEHMVIILIVFLTLVSGMCASIIVSCWGKIQERRRRKLEYHMKKSREASMEGQINKVGQMYDSNDDSNNVNTITASNNTKKRISALVAPSENQPVQHQQYNAKYTHESDLFGPINDQRQLVNPRTDFDPPRQHQTSASYLMQPQQILNRNNTIAGDNYGQTYDSDQGSPATLQQMIGSSNPNLHANFRILPQQYQPSNPQDRSMSVYGTRSRVSDSKNLSDSRRSLVCGRSRMPLFASSRIAQMHDSDAGSDVAKSLTPVDTLLDRRQKLAQRSTHVDHIVNHSALQMSKRPAYLRSTSMHNDILDSDSCRRALNTNHRLQSRQQPVPSAVPILRDTDQQRILLNSFQHLKNPDHGNRRAPTTSTKHQLYGDNQSICGNEQQLSQSRNSQAGLYGVNQNRAISLGANNLSSSVTCCDAIGETPLLSDLIKQATLRQQANSRLLQVAQANQAMKLQQQMTEPVSATANIPRSISAYQLSKSIQRQNQQLQLQRQLLQQQQQQAQSSYSKSMSDAGQANKHLPPNHSISYPHACSGPHSSNSAVGSNDSPALPPPPPPPNWIQHQTGRSQTSCGTLPPQISDSKRQAFKVSRLDPSQLTGDTLPDSDLIMTNMPIGSIQFDDVSTESDATFGMMIDSVGNASLNFAPQIHRPSERLNQQQPLLHGQSYRPLQMIPHLSECNLVRRQRSEALASEGGSVGRQQMLLSQSSCTCDCGATERFNQLRREQSLLSQQIVPTLQQRQMYPASARDFDIDSDEAKAMRAAPYGFIGDMNGSNTVISAQTRPDRLMMQVGYGTILNHNDAQQGNIFNQRHPTCLDRFRQQSSELTADDDEDVEEDDRDVADVYVANCHGGQLDVDDDDLSSDLAVCPSRGADERKPNAKFNASTGTPKSIVRRNEQELRDAEDFGVRQRYLSGSRTSICTCGSQAKVDINNLGDDEDQIDRTADPVDAERVSLNLIAMKSQKVSNNSAQDQGPNSTRPLNEIAPREIVSSQQDSAT